MMAHVRDHPPALFFRAARDHAKRKLGGKTFSDWFFFIPLSLSLFLSLHGLHTGH